MDTTTGGVAGTAGGVEVEAVRLIVDVALWVLSAELVAVIWILCAAIIVAGAVYKPPTTVPTFALSDQVTAVFEVPLTTTVYCLDWPAASEIGIFGFIEILTAVVAAGAAVVGVAGVVAGPNIMVALALWVG